MKNPRGGGNRAGTQGWKLPGGKGSSTGIDSEGRYQNVVVIDIVPEIQPTYKTTAGGVKMLCNVENYDSESISAMNLPTVSQHRLSADGSGFITLVMFTGYIEICFSMCTCTMYRDRTIRPNWSPEG